jgi:FMN phosphatase YigB (HAD superfamily)
MMPDWSSIRLVVFDVDGTLYDQGRMRRAMAWDLARTSLRQRSLKTIRVLKVFRQVREQLGEHPAADFANEQFSLTARRCECPERHVRHLVADWIDHRPLAKMSRYRAHGVAELFDCLRRTGRQLAAWSDYPVSDKLEALGLKVDLQTWSGEEGVAALKPNPAGLAQLLDRAGREAGETLMVGDRFDRDWEGAAAIGVSAIIRSRRADRRAPTFRDYRDPLFAPVLAEAHND